MQSHHNDICQQNKQRGATQEEAGKLSGMRLILVRIFHMAMESYWMMSGV